MQFVNTLLMGVLSTYLDQAQKGDQISPTWIAFLIGSILGGIISLNLKGKNLTKISAVIWVLLIPAHALPEMLVYVRLGIGVTTGVFFSSIFSSMVVLFP